MGVLNSTGYFNGDKDKWIEKRHLMLEFFKGKVLSVLIVDPNNEMPLEEIEKALPDLFLKSFDLADCKDGDFNRIGQHLGKYINDGKCAYDGLLFDNVDCINAGKDTEDLQTMVWQSLKRDDSETCGYQILPFGDAIPFDKMMIAARCKEIPDYLKDKSLQRYIIEV
ncbi:MAG: hypothetical protein K2K98_06455 [Muribaculaceae bacterium]|nr:hypothetical protein [Muribaculaceae bacterium]